MPFASKKYNKRLRSIKKGVIAKFKKGKPGSWRNRDFEDLSFEVRKATRVLISAATLKRIFGKNKTSESYFPQESTLEALESYAGEHIPKTIKIKKWVLSGVLVSVFFIGFILFMLLRIPSDKNSNFFADLSVDKVEGNTPATAFFNLNIPASEASVFISFGDGHPDQIVPEGVKSLSHVYNYPGLFDVILKRNGEVCSDTLNVLVPTEGWQALAHYFQQDYTDRLYPVPLSLAVGADGFHPTGRDLASIGIDTTQIVVLRLDNFRRTASNGDNFLLKTRLKNSRYWPAIRCYSAFITVVGEKGLINLKFTNEGCSGFGEFVLGETTGRGSDSDLSGLSMDIKEWNDIEVENSNKALAVKVADETVFRHSYEQSIGNIVGVSLQFHGSGYVDYFELSDENLNPLFTTDF